MTTGNFIAYYRVSADRQGRGGNQYATTVRNVMQWQQRESEAA